MILTKGFSKHMIQLIKIYYSNLCSNGLNGLNEKNIANVQRLPTVKVPTWQKKVNIKLATLQPEAGSETQLNPV